MTAFVSYSHNHQSHKDWVLALATRLRSLGVDVILDQWDLTPGMRNPSNGLRGGC
ncbi:MAG: toll/interleukin-1 receptor domain-containing protein [Propionibacteriaceae bacterium]|nr:toll/interleukin-1 receptor domain-containing protein [Propionibacteriaceae bacterium]